MKKNKIYFLLTLLLFISQKQPDNFFAKSSLGIDILAGLVKVKPEKNEPFDKLRLTKEDKVNITFIIKNMGEQGKLWLSLFSHIFNNESDIYFHY